MCTTSYSYTLPTYTGGDVERTVTLELEYPNILDKTFLKKVGKLKAYLLKKQWNIKETEIFISTK